MFSGSPERRHLADYFQRPLHSGDRVRGRLWHYSSTGESHTWNVKENKKLRPRWYLFTMYQMSKQWFFSGTKRVHCRFRKNLCRRTEWNKLPLCDGFGEKVLVFLPMSGSCGLKNKKILQTMRWVMQPGPGWGWPKLALLFLLLINVTNGSEDWPCHMNLLKQHVIWKIHFNSGTQITEEF